MGDIETLVSRALAYAEQAQLEPSTVSRKILGNGMRLRELQEGKSLHVHTLVRALQTLDDLERRLQDNQA